MTLCGARTLRVMWGGAMRCLEERLRHARHRPVTYRRGDNVPFRGPRFRLLVRAGRVLSEAGMTDGRHERR
jgi:hypothetical protein